MRVDRSCRGFLPTCGRSRRGIIVLPSASETLELDGLVDEHDGDVVPDRVEDVAVFPNDTSVDRILYRLASPVRKLTRLDGPIDPVQQLLGGGGHRLLGLGTHQDLQELRIHHPGLPRGERTSF